MWTVLSLVAALTWGNQQPKTKRFFYGKLKNHFNHSFHFLPLFFSDYRRFSKSCSFFIIVGVSAEAMLNN